MLDRLAPVHIAQVSLISFHVPRLAMGFDA
jgi:hypothetical protein